ncbi:carboxypeptidase [Streptomyces sp. NPDC001255]|uniref:carboxypeptidase n=1 Tax=Streptomyces sp. NPDC001255 TaxID=3364550 RepID=UPI0036AD8788
MNPHPHPATPALARPAHPGPPGPLTRLALDLDRAYPWCTYTVAGTTDGGRPLEVLTVRGGGDRSVVALAGAHPDEETAHTQFHLIHRLAAHPALRAGVTWHLVLDADPDGAALNHHPRPGSIAGHFDHTAFYRPPIERQPLWAFTLQDPPGFTEPKTTLILRALLDETRPTVLCDFHRCLSGGAYTLTTRPHPPTNSLTARVAATAGVPLAVSGDEGGDPLTHNLAPGVWLTPDDDGSGPDRRTSAWHYAAHHHTTLGVVIEAPQWIIEPGRESGPASADRLRDAHARLTTCADAVPDLALTPHGEAARARLDLLLPLAEQEAAREHSIGPVTDWTILRVSSALAAHAVHTDDGPEGAVEAAVDLHRHLTGSTTERLRYHAVPSSATVAYHLGALVTAVHGAPGLNALWRHK